MFFMRVLFFNYEYPPLGGGAANATIYILREFSRLQNLEVDLITSSIDREYHLEKTGSNVNIHKIPVEKNKNNLHYQSHKDLIVYAWKVYFFSRKLIRKNKYDLSHSFFSVPCGFLSLLIKWQYKTPYVVSLRGSDVPGYSERFPVIYKFLTPVIKVIWKNASLVVSNSEGLKNLALKSKSEQEIEIIYNGVDIEEFKPGLDIEYPSEAFRIICVSRITGRKGIQYLIEAVSRLISKYPQIQLQIVGEGDEKKNLVEQAKKLKLENIVEFCGLIEHNKLPIYYQDADIFVLPSLNEGMSNTMLEALSSGLPIIATDTGGTRELVREGVNGFVVKMRDSDDIAQKIEKLIQNEDLRRNMAIESRKIAEKFSWKNIAGQYLAIYKKITGAIKK